MFRYLNECVELVQLGLGESEFSLQCFQSLRALLGQTMHLFRRSLLQLSHGLIALAYARLEDGHSLLLGMCKHKAEIPSK